jgi:pilus assembly protein Flp/PilA
MPTKAVSRASWSRPLPQTLVIPDVMTLTTLVDVRVTAIEYGLIAAAISVAIIAVVQGSGSNLKKTFGSVSSALK